MMTKKLNKSYAIIAVIILLAVFVPWHQAMAASVLVDYIGGKAIAATIGWIGNLIFTFLGKAISSFAQLLEKFIQLQTEVGIYNIPAVDLSWTIVRNFANLFFILVLIIMAFGTIFSIQKYTWKQMLVPFLIAALLINFSLTIGQYIITVSNGLANVFLNQMQDVGGISKNFQDGFSSAKIITSGEKSAVAILSAGDAVAGVGDLVITLIFSIIFLVAILLAFVAVAIFSIVRLFVLWFLLIISPIAWLGYSFPNLKNQTFIAWWKQFWCWCFFLPYFLFFMMFAVGFIKYKNQISLPAALGNISVGGMLGNDLIFYILSLIFLFGGLGIARKMACATGTGVSAMFGKIEGGVRKYAPGAAYVRGGIAGLKERGAEIMEKGALGLPGAQQARIQEATAKGWVAGIPGPGKVPGAREEASRAQAAEVDKEVKRIQTLNLTLDQLNERLQSKNAPEKIAALKIKSENGWLEAKDLDEVNKTLREAGGGRTALGASLISSLKKGRFHEMAQTTAQKEFIFDNLKDVELKKAFGLDMAESREVMNEKLAKQLLDLYGSDNKEVKDKVEESVRKNIENFARKKDDRAAFLLNTDADKRIRKMVGEIMVDKKEVSNLQSRQAVIDLIGKDTPEGREAIKNIGVFNPLLNIEAKLREERGIAIGQPLSEADAKRVIGELKDKLQEKLVKNELKEIKMMSPDFFKDSRFKEAAQEVFADPVDMSRLIKDSPKDMRVALKDLPGTRGRRP